MPRTTPSIDTGDIPQAPNLARVRCVVTAIAGGLATLEQIAEETDIAVRHVGYAVRAAQTLGLLDKRRALTALGKRLIETDQESDAERAAFRDGIEASAALRLIAPDLLSAEPPEKKTLAGRIERRSGLSRATALHRASDLLAWREQLLDEADAPVAPGDAPVAAEDGHLPSAGEPAPLQSEPPSSGPDDDASE